ncbi:hypothetical protein Acr_05g0012350 [Actinidia rufa]|uniref:Cation/H+ exchanger domain-containing protein n=1 Tax=Actinidia rufa TaxID=165716 RepID=A0A7J0EN63_9ERIC|nr:hypothetical protein Acr_05g0012350 [Actinidia rufa]
MGSIVMEPDDKASYAGIYHPKDSFSTIWWYNSRYLTSGSNRWIYTQPFPNSRYNCNISQWPMGKISLEQKTTISLPIVATLESVLAFPMMAQYLSELKMINSEFGRLALSCSIVINLFGFCVITLTMLMNQQSGEKFVMIKALLPKTKGESTTELIYVIFVGVLVAAFASQASGLNICYGPFLYGFAVPAGPPLGSALVEKLELINSLLFMPLYFVKNGLCQKWVGDGYFPSVVKSYLVVQFTIVIAWVGKFLGALMSSRMQSYLGLVLNVQGVLDLGMYKKMKQAIVKIMNDNILDMAPCSVAIIVDHGLLNNSRPTLATWSPYRAAVFFLGGADEKEALAVRARMAGQPNINLTMYTEEVAKDGTGTIAAMRSMKDNYELIIVGRRHGKWSPLILGLSGWNEETELGAVGDKLASEDFHGNNSILVVQQHAIAENERHELKKSSV